ncbi:MULTISPECIES: LapA family protein [Streptomyces]|uniref:LapA family protein n=1 Tax=Streptomyces heilongjiangensis TaxID=945052 RepID=A0ABW1B6Z0_9ACTN|nr:MULTISPECIES: LapA family protein [Streptomyces]MDC2947679.1 LapA family protein [Streptomyces heilongjiangensis]
MSPKTTTSDRGRARARGPRQWGDMLTPGRVTVGLLAVLALVFIFENTRTTRIRLLIPEVTMPLWLALLGTALIGAVCGAYFMKRRW